jgi:hypothetical protein
MPPSAFILTTEGTEAFHGEQKESSLHYQLNELSHFQSIDRFLVEEI